MGSDIRFASVLAELQAMHDRKGADYGADSDEYANVRASREFGVAPWVGAMVRLNDKVHRLKQFAVRGSLANETARDSLIDIAVYAVIATILHDETAQQTVAASRAQDAINRISATAEQWRASHANLSDDWKTGWAKAAQLASDNTALLSRLTRLAKRRLAKRRAR